MEVPETEELCSGMVLSKLNIEKGAESILILGSEPIYSSIVPSFSELFCLNTYNDLLSSLMFSMPNLPEDLELFLT